MLETKEMLKIIANRYQDILGTNLVGIYLHGSLAMNCFNPDQSDIDFLVVLHKNIDFGRKRRLVDVLLKYKEHNLNNRFEMSVVLKEDIVNLKYPTPFLLHYSDYHKRRYLDDPKYICGELCDADLVAHFMVIKNRGLCLYGETINKVFHSIPRKYYIQSIVQDVSDAKKEIVDRPTYYILNLCRVVYYLKEGKVSSKKEG